jgi:hypothetical protein
VGDRLTTAGGVEPGSLAKVGVVLDCVPIVSSLFLVCLMLLLPCPIIRTPPLSLMFLVPMLLLMATPRIQSRIEQ